jgi:hypothetical protein
MRRESAGPDDLRAALGRGCTQCAACEPDAMRLCQQYISDIGRVRSCMSHYRRYLSSACRAVFQGGAKKKVRRFRR